MATPILNGYARAVGMIVGILAIVGVAVTATSAHYGAKSDIRTNRDSIATTNKKLDRSERHFEELLGRVRWIEIVVVRIAVENDIDVDELIRTP